MSSTARGWPTSAVRFLSALLISAATLVGCGGGGGSDSLPPQPYTGPSIGTGTLKANAYVLDQTAAEASIFTSLNLTVKKPQAKTFRVGDVLVVDGHGGRLVKIEAVQESPEAIVYQYSIAGLSDVFESLDIAIKGELGQDDLGASLGVSDPEVDISWLLPKTAQSSSAQLPNAVAASTNTLQIKYKKLGAQVGSGIEIDGTSSFVLNPDFFMKLTAVANQPLPSLELGATVRPDLSTSVSIASLYGGQISYNIDKKFKLKPFRRVIIVPVAGIPIPVPFWITPAIVLSGGVNGTAGSKFTTTHNYSVSGGLGFTRTVSRGLETLAELSHNGSIDVSEVQSEFGVLLSAPKVEVQFMLYSFAGPSFDIGLESGVVGKSTVKGAPAIEGVEVKSTASVVANAGLKAALEFKNIDAVKKLFGNFSFEYTALSMKLWDKVLAERLDFFPYSGAAAITARDNGNVPDDIFEIALDGVVLGRTNKGGSGQFRVKNLRPGTRNVSLTTVEDDVPPGTYEMLLGDGLTFADGTLLKAGTATLGKTVTFTVIVP